MDITAILTMLGIVFPIFPPLPSDLIQPCVNASIPRKKIIREATNSTITVWEPKLTKIANAGASEGPVFDNKGNLFVVNMDETSSNQSRFSDSFAGKLYKINEKTGETSVACVPWVNGFGGRPSGCQADRHGNIWIADMRLGLLKYTPGAGCVQLSKVDSDGNPLQGMNDLIFDQDGNLWITAPGGQIAPASAEILLSYKENIGALYFLRKGESTPQRMHGEKFRYSNGIAIKNNRLYVAEFMTGKIIRFDITGPGQLDRRTDWAAIPQDAAMLWKGLEIGGPDGMDFDASGRLLVANWASSHLEVISPYGELEARIKTSLPEITNVQFKPNSPEIYVTEFANGSVWKFEWRCRGMPMFSDLR